MYQSIWWMYHSHPQIWSSWVSRVAEMSFFCRVTGFSLRNKVRSLDTWRELGIQSLLVLLGKEPVGVFRVSGYHASWAPSFGGFTKHIQNTLEGLYISSGLGTPRDPSGGAWNCCWGEGCLGCFAWPVTTTSPPWIRAGRWRIEHVPRKKLMHLSVTKI